MRVGALQDWPLLSKQANVPARTACANSWLARMILADFPPNSWLTRLTVSAAALATATPPRWDPVNDTMST
ncbi:hypothetical protein D3C80_2183220 [compost metagenome]